MSDMNYKIERVVDNKWLTASHRIMVLIIGCVMLPLMSWLGLLVWTDIRESKQAIVDLGTELRGRIGKVETDQAVTAAQLQDVTRRVEKLEDHRQGMLTPIDPPDTKTP